MSRKEFVPLNLLAKLAGISRQAVWKACQRGNWRGHSLEVRVDQRPARIVMPKKPLISEERRRKQDDRIAAQMDLVKRIVG